MENNTTTPGSSNLNSTPEPTVPEGTPPQPESPKQEVKNGQGTPKKPGGMGKMLMVLMLILLTAAGAAYGGYTMAKSKADKKEAVLNTKITALEATEHEIPEGAVKISGCIPNMGFHYLPKDSDPIYGPFLLVNSKDKVIGTEYMMSDDMYTVIPGVTPPVELILKDSPLFGWKYDHAEVSHAPEGHHGLLKDHIDIHLYTVTKAAQKQSCQE